MASSSPFALEAIELTASLTVKNLPASLAWYRDILGFAVTKTHERGGQVIAASLEAGSVRILLGQDDGARGLERSKGDGFSLQITTRQDVDEIAARVRAAAGVLETEPTNTPWGPRMFRFRDPDGFRFTISTPAARPEEG